MKALLPIAISLAMLVISLTIGGNYKPVPEPDYTDLFGIGFETILLAGFLIFIFIIVLWYKLDYTFYFLAFFAPLSISIPLLEGQHQLNFPAEGYLVATAMIFMAIFFRSGLPDKKLFTHPLSLIVLFFILVKIFTILSSDYTLVSIKSTIAFSLFVFVFYFLTIIFFSQKKTNAIHYFSVLILSSLIVCIYCINRINAFDYIMSFTTLVPKPFYNDHTLYATCIAMIIPLVAGLVYKPSAFNLKKQHGMIALAALIILLTAFFLAYSRGAWLAFVLSGFLGFLMIMGLQFRHYLLILALVLTVIYWQKDNVSDRMKLSDRHIEERGAREHFASITELESNVSNLERINRWQSAIRMFKERPLTGFGPGTYQFSFPPFQDPREMTVISIRGPGPYPHGHGGTAHSEFFLAMSESGILGLIGITLLFASAFYYATKAYRLADHNLKVVVLCIFCGIVIYIIHAFFNNFLDTIEATAILFPLYAWLFIILDKLKSEE